MNNCIYDYLYKIEVIDVTGNYIHVFVWHQLASIDLMLYNSCSEYYVLQFSCTTGMFI